jgi:hypothetical protein
MYVCVNLWDTVDGTNELHQHNKTFSTALTEHGAAVSDVPSMCSTARTLCRHMLGN